VNQKDKDTVKDIKRVKNTEKGDLPKRDAPNGWPAELRRWLTPSYFWRRSVHNLLPKIAALLVATLVWLVSTADRRETTEIGFDVPLQVRDTTGGSSKRVVSNLPARVRVTLRGQRSRLQALQTQVSRTEAGIIEANVDTTGAQDGSFTLPVVVLPPEGTEAVRVLPSRVQGFVDSQLSRSLTLVLSAPVPPAGSLPHYTLTPGTVTLSGPSRLVRTVSRVITQPLELEAGETGRTRLVALNEAGEPVTGIRLQPLSVAVRRTDLGVLPVKTVSVLLPPVPANLNVQSTVIPGTIRLVGPPATLAALDTVTAVLTYRPGSSRLTPIFRLPAGVQALDSVKVSLEVSAKPQP
jgi:YbbR-like protein